jgi:hypothetical protein
MSMGVDEYAGFGRRKRANAPSGFNTPVRIVTVQQRPFKAIRTMSRTTLSSALVFPSHPYRLGRGLWCELRRTFWQCFRPCLYLP